MLAKAQVQTGIAAVVAVLLALLISDSLLLSIGLRQFRHKAVT